MPQHARHQLTDLGPASAFFRHLLWDDIPEEWRTLVPAEVLANYAARMGVYLVLPAVCVELPDFLWAWHDNRWAQQPVSQHCRTGDLLLVVVVAQEDLRGVFDDGEGRALSAKVLWSLQVEGRPLPLISRIFTPSNKNEDKVY